tara:strand:- start:398 stop:538 length:141 start_codon:yes stop_codon:yes gene_type:complete
VAGRYYSGLQAVGVGVNDRRNKKGIGRNFVYIDEAQAKSREKDQQR